MPATNAAGMAAAQQRHHRRDEQHHDNGEGLRVRIALLQQRDDEIGPGRTAERGGEDELAPPHAGGLLLVARVEKSDRQRIAGCDRAGDEGDPGGERAGVHPGQRRRADAERDNPEHGGRAAVDLGEKTHHRARVARNRVGLGKRPPRLSELDGHLAPARCGFGVGATTASAQIRTDFPHKPPDAHALTRVNHAAQMINDLLTRSRAIERLLRII